MGKNKLLLFSNPGEIDPIMFNAFGVSAKGTNDAIGFFGTGLKYAISIVVRHGGTFLIYSGNRRFEFAAGAARDLRGKQFNFITCNGKELGFTTELGKKWVPWMAYRELYSNTLDEGGTVELVDHINSNEGETKIYVGLPEMFQAHANRNQIFLDTTPLHVGQTAQIHPGRSKVVYYRGIAASDLHRSSLFTYNITTALDLTEDRTAKYSFMVDHYIARAIAQLSDPSIIRQIFTQSANSMESGLSYEDNFNFSPVFLDVARECYRKDPVSIPPSLVSVVTKIDPGTIFESITLTAIEKQKLDAANEFCKAIGFSISDYELKVVETLGPNVLAMAIRNTNRIVVSRRVFHQGLKQLCSTLIEEIVHLREGLNDNTREMQTFLFDYITTMGEQITGQSL